MENKNPTQQALRYFYTPIGIAPPHQSKPWGIKSSWSNKIFIFILFVLIIGNFGVFAQEVNTYDKFIDELEELLEVGNTERLKERLIEYWDGSDYLGGPSSSLKSNRVKFWEEINEENKKFLIPQLKELDKDGNDRISSFVKDIYASKITEKIGTINPQVSVYLKDAKSVEYDSGYFKFDGVLLSVDNPVLYFKKVIFGEMKGGLKHITLVNKDDAGSKISIIGGERVVEQSYDDKGNPVDDRYIIKKGKIGEQKKVGYVNFQGTLSASLTVMGEGTEKEKFGKGYLIFDATSREDRKFARLEIIDQDGNLIEVSPDDNEGAFIANAISAAKGTPKNIFHILKK